MIGFSNPVFLWLLIPAAFILLYTFKYGKGSFVSFPFSFWNKKCGIKPGFLYAFLYYMSVISFFSAILFAILATAGPYITDNKKTVSDTPPVIMIALDVSPSMGAMDVPGKPRFEIAKQVIKDFASEYPGISLGLVTFGNDAVLDVPPTLDRNFLLDKLSEKRVFSLGDGTALGMGLGVALLHLSGVESSYKAIILVTDGKNTAGEIFPETAAALAGEMGIPIYAIGIGSDKPVRLDIVDPSTGTRYSGTLEEGFDKDLLMEISSISGGAFFSAYTQNYIKNIFRRIASLSSDKQELKYVISKRDIHYDFIFYSLIAFSFWLFLSRLVLREVL
ncbi:VWA domain-containing protein [Spirochaetia bacterium 38H-sp]|uniref:VWA domain-containing protein n=1 Tax=Rarispira pelagica TaxID=3141764 RepID=A0ABU9UCH9_9SPIR